MKITSLKFEHQKALAALDQGKIPLPELKKMALFTAEPVLDGHREYWRDIGKEMISTAKSKKATLEAVKIIFGWAEQEAVASVAEHNKLAEILNHVTGDSWNGTHTRQIAVERLSDGNIIVSNSYVRYDPQSILRNPDDPEKFRKLDGGDTLGAIFAEGQLNELESEDGVQYTRYYEDYLACRGQITPL